MAVDSRNKRASAVNIASPWRGLLPEPDDDDAATAAERAQVAFLYGGLLAGAAGAEANRRTGWPFIRPPGQFLTPFINPPR